MPNNIFKISITFLFSLFLSFTVTAQTNGAEGAKDRVGNRTNRRIDQKIDQGVDRTLDKIEGLFRKKKNRSNEETDAPNEEIEEVEYEEEEMTDEEEKQANDFLGSLNLGGKFEPFENPVKMNISMDITTVDRKGKSSEMTIDYTLDTWATAIKVISEDTNVRMLMDNKEGYQTIITVDKGQTQAIRMRQMSFDMADFTPDESEFTITETSNTRTIDGYFCKEYIIEHEDGTTNTWVTEDADVDMLSITKALASQARNKKMPTQNYFDIQGFPVESTTVSSNGKETTTIRYYDVVTGEDTNLDVFDTTGIEIMSIGF